MEGSLIGRTVAHSRTEQVQILMQGTLNGYNRLFGGKLMEWIDVVAASRYRSETLRKERNHRGCGLACVQIPRYGKRHYPARGSCDIRRTHFYGGMRYDLCRRAERLPQRDKQGVPRSCCHRRRRKAHARSACNSRDRGRKTRIRRRHGEKKKPRQQKIIPPYRDSLVFYSAQSFMMFSIISADFSMPSTVMCS